MKNLEELTLQAEKCQTLEGLKQLSESILESDQVHPQIRRKIGKVILEHRQSLIDENEEKDNSNVQIISDLNEHKIELDPFKSICVFGDVNMLRTPSKLDEAKINETIKIASQLDLTPIINMSPNSAIEYDSLVEAMNKKYTDVNLMLEDGHVSGPFGIVKDQLLNHPEIKNIVLVCEENHVEDYELAGQFFMNESKENRFIICPVTLDPIEDDGVPINECYMYSLIDSGDYKQFSQLSMFTEDSTNQSMYHQLLKYILEEE